MSTVQQSAATQVATDIHTQPTTIRNNN